MSAAAGQSGAPAGSNSSFGLFRATTFVDSRPKPSRTSAKSHSLRTTLTSSAAPKISNGGGQSSTSAFHAAQTILQATAPASLSSHNPPSVIISPTTAISTANTTDSLSASAENSLCSPQLAPVPLREGKLGPHRDGRVRNPVPRKLKGKTDKKNGNFAVMHMDMPGSGSVHKVPRAEAAQRTSENTANAAILAQKDGYVPVKRRRVQLTSDTCPEKDGSAANELERVVSHHGGGCKISQTVSIISEKTKYEQARLLTLLRSINPLTVVDQLCKALAFFGGIPGAPPSEERTFPDSAEANGSGALFVGWLSEIFPNVDGKNWSSDNSRKPRGRPKGSKASKVRKDKGLKKGFKISGKDDDDSSRSQSSLRQQLSSLAGPNRNSGILEEWEDIGDGDSMNYYDVDRPIAQAHVTGELREKEHLNSRHHDVLSTSARGSFSVDICDSSSQHMPSTSPGSKKRRPGRPKGSRNRLRTSEPDNAPAHNIIPSAPEHQSLLQRLSSPLSDVGGHEYRPSDLLTVLPGIEKTPAPPASVIQKIATAVIPQSAPVPTTNTPLNKSGPKSLKGSRTPYEPISTSKPLDENISIYATLPEVQPLQVTVALPPRPEAVEAIRKRKRPRSKTAVATTEQASSSTSAAPLSKEVEKRSPPNKPTASVDILTQGGASVQEHPILPPTKRQRKPHDSKLTSLNKKALEKEEGAVVATPSRPRGMKAQAVITPRNNPSGAMLPAANPLNPISTAHGLEAHYQRFASLQLHQQPQPEPQSRLQSQPHSQSLRDQTNISRSSPMLSSDMFFPAQPNEQQRQQHPQLEQQNHSQPQTQSQPLNNHGSISRLSPMLSSNVFYQSQQQQQPERPQQYYQNDSYRDILGQRRNNNLQLSHDSFGSRQQQQSPQIPFDHFPSTTFIDVPSLDSLADGTANVNSYGPNLSRSTSHGSFSGTHSQLGIGIGVANTFQPGLNENELRDRILKGMGGFERR